MNSQPIISPIQSSNVSIILKNKGVGLNAIQTDEVSLKKYLQQLILLRAAFEAIPITGQEICDKGFVITCNDTIVYHNPANKEIITIFS